MALYAGIEADYGNATVRSLANDIEAMLLALMPEAVRGDVRQRRRFIVALAQGVINHINQHIEAQVGQMMLRLKDGTKVVLDAPTIELVAGATQPVVLGDQLTSYLSQLVTLFNNHEHPGQMAGFGAVTPAPPGDPFPLPTPDLLSTRVRAG